MRSPIYVEPIESDSSSLVNLPIYLSNKNTKFNSVNETDRNTPNQNTFITSLSPINSNEKRKKNTIRLTKTILTRTTTTSTTTDSTIAKPVSLAIKRDLPIIENSDRKTDKYKTKSQSNDDLIETFEITEKNQSSHRRFSKPPLIAYTHNISNQDSENKSNFRTRRNSIILNLDKYVLNNKISDIKNTKYTSSNKMVNIPIAPKKYHTFNENEAPSHKEIKNRITLATTNENEEKNETNESIRKNFMVKPLKRTGSTVNNVNNLQKPLARRPPKEFLSAMISTSNSNEFKLTSCTRTNSRDNFNTKEDIFSNDYPNRTISPTMKSLPTYDEALKRVSTDTNKITKIINQQNSSNSTKTFNSNSANKASESNASTYVPSLYSNTNEKPIFKNRSTLPNLHVQSTFKSLLVQPANNSSNLTNNMINNGNNISSKVYFRPQDLNSSNRLIQIQAIKSNNNIENLNQNNQNEIFVIPKNLSERSNSQIVSTPIIANKVIGVKKLNLNALNDETRNMSPLLKENTGLPPTPILTTRLNIDTKSDNSLNKVIPTATITTTTSTNNYIATKKTSSIFTTTTTSASDVFNTIKPGIKSTSGFSVEKNNNIITQVESPAPLVANTDQKLKSWPLTNQNINLKKILSEQENKNNPTQERAFSSENRPQSSLTNWKSTATASTFVTSSPFASDTNLNKNFETAQIISDLNIQSKLTNAQNNKKLDDSNYALLSSGKLVDAVKAAAIGSNNSVEDGLGLVARNIMPNLIKKKANSTKTSSISAAQLKKHNHVNLGFIEDEYDSQLKTNDYNKDKNRYKKNRSIEDSFSSSYTSSSTQSSKDIFKDNYAKSKNSQDTKLNKRDECLSNITNTDSKREVIKTFSNKNNGNMPMNIVSKSSSQTTDTNLNNIFNRIKNKDSSTVTDQVAERPPGRLNYYDSDTFSEFFPANGRNLKNNKNNKINQELQGIMSDSPNLSDLSEGRFDDINGGHRTSTPNMSKQKRSASLSTPEIKHIKKQIQDLENMYHEILKIIDTEKNSISTSQSSYSTSFSSFNHTIRESNLKKRTGLRSSSLKNSDKASDINYLKHRFNRMETHLTSLAKTVAQISLELRTMKSVEHVILNLKKEIQEIKNFNSGLSNSNKPNELFRSTSEPQLLNSFNVKENEEILIKEISCNKLLNRNIFFNSTFNSHNKNLQENQDVIDKSRKKDSIISEKFRNWATWSSSYTNPLKLKKLTKFFGQEPPMLRLFLQKLNYETYASNFESEHITITELPYLSEERLRQIGIPLGPRLRILQEAQASFSSPFYV